MVGVSSEPPSMHPVPDWLVPPGGDGGARRRGGPRLPTVARPRRRRRGLQIALLGAAAVTAVALIGLRPRGEAEDAPPPERAATIDRSGTPSPLGLDDYPWPHQGRSYLPLAHRVPLPVGYTEVPAAPGSFAEWLRHLPALPPGASVVTTEGLVITTDADPGVAAVLDLDVRPDQECADVILRLRAEWLRRQGREGEIVFNLTGPGEISWPEWTRGMRPVLHGQQVGFERRGEPGDSREAFDGYLRAVCAWCSTVSLAKDGVPAAAGDLRIGDYVSRPELGSAGHAMLVVDLARSEDGRVVALFAEGLMPAQTPHAIRGNGPAGWVEVDPSADFDVLAWRRFEWSLHRRFEAGGRGG
jgi:hypothetical protein